MRLTAPILPATFHDWRERARVGAARTFEPTGEACSRWSAAFALAWFASVGLCLLPRVLPPNGGEEEGHVSATEIPLSGDALLRAVNEELVALHQRYYHRRPVTAKTQLLGDDLLACVMGGVYTEVEQTMIEVQRSRVVRDVRNAFQETMQHRFIEVVERLSRRDVAMFTSDSHVGPDLEIELFLLAPGI